MKPVRLVVAAVVVVVMAIAIAGVGMGGPPKSADAAPTGAQLAASKTRIAQGGAMVKEGQAEFKSEGCASCHAMAADGISANLGPRLDTDHDKADEILTSITKPRADIVEGYEPNLMPTDYGKKMSKDELNAVVAYIQATAGKDSKGGG